MGTVTKKSVWGELHYGGKTYGVLNGFEVSEQVWKKLTGEGEKSEMDSGTAPWQRMKFSWYIEDYKLYLTKEYSEAFLSNYFEGKSLFVDWIDELVLLDEHRKICRTHEKKGSYLDELKTLRVHFAKGEVTDVTKENEIYTSIEMRDYIDPPPSFATLRIESQDQLFYLDYPEKQPKEDRLLPLLLGYLDEMPLCAKQGDKVLDKEVVKSILKKGDVVVYTSAKGSNAEEMVDALVESVTEGVLQAKRCLVQLTTNSEYSEEKVRQVFELMKKRLGFDRHDPLDAYIPERRPFVVSRCVS